MRHSTGSGNGSQRVERSGTTQGSASGRGYTDRRDTRVSTGGTARPDGPSPVEFERSATTDPDTHPERRSVRVTIVKQPSGSDSTVGICDGTQSTLQFVDYASPIHRDLINSLSEGAVVDVEIEQVVARGTCWRVLGVHARSDGSPQDR